MSAIAAGIDPLPDGTEQLRRPLSRASGDGSGACPERPRSARRSSPCSCWSRSSARRSRRLTRPQPPRVRRSRSAPPPPSARHDRDRPGRALATARRHPLDGRARGAHRGDRDPPVGRDRDDRGLPRRCVRRGAVAARQRVPGPARAAAAGRDARLPPALRRAADGDRAERARVAVGRARDPRSDAVAAQPRLRRRRTGVR